MSATRSSIRASPDDPALTEYWAARRRKTPLPVNRTHQWLYRAQDGRCHTCHGILPAAADRPQTPADWERWLVANRTAIKMITVPPPARRASLNPV